MNLDELRTVQSEERRTDSLQNLRPSFYREVGEYIADLEAERERVAERADDPFSSPEVGRLTDEIETAKDVVEAIYERRMGKIVKQASLAAAGMPADDEGLTAEEADLFDDLVDRIQANKGRVLDVLEGTETATDEREADDAPPAPPDAPSEGEPGRTEPAADGSARAADPADRTGDAPDREPEPADVVSAADVMGGAGDPAAGSESTPGRSEEPEARPADPQRDGTDGSDGTATDDTRAAANPADEDDATDPDVDRITVRITRDVGSILGVDDREYSLAPDDVVTLPERNATPLVERDAAERLE